MRLNRKYLFAVALLAVLAVVFGLAGTVAPGSELVSPQSSSSSSSSDSVTHFQNPPSFDSGWVDIRDKPGKYFTLTHGLNTTEAVVDIRGKQSLDPDGGALVWGRTYGGAGSDYGRSLVQTGDGGYSLGGYTGSFGAAGLDGWLVKFDSSGNFQWNRTYGGAGSDIVYSVVQTGDGGYALGGYTNSFGAAVWDGWLVKFDSFGNFQWNTTYGGAGHDRGYSLVQTLDGGYALGGYTNSFGAVGYDGWLVKFDSAGNVQWDKTFGWSGDDDWCSVVQTGDGGYALGGYTNSFGAGYVDGWLVKTDVENGLAWNSLTNYAITLYRGKTDPYWNYVRVRIWTIKEPTWMFGDINQDGVVDAEDLYIVSRNYGKTFSLLSLTGIIGIAGIYTYKKRKKQSA